jgi:uncharacterized protein YcbX
MKVRELWRYPVKSLAGERLERAEIATDGFVGDRLLRVERSGKPITARTKPQLIEISAAIGENDQPLVAGKAWDSEEAIAAVRGAATEDVTLVPTTRGRRFDAAPVLVATDGALAELGEDRRRFRPNVLIEGVEGLAERRWIGHELGVGEAILKVVESCERCKVTTIDPDTFRIRPDVLERIRAEFDGIMGVYCAVMQPGMVAVGDSVTLRLP